MAAILARDGHVTVSPGKVEIGQGIVTALAQIAADELDVDLSAACRWSARRRPAAPTRASPRAASPSSSPAARCATPAPRSGRSFLQLRRSGWASASTRSTIEDGTISGPGNVRTSYWELADEVSLDRDATPGAAPKTVGAPRAGRAFGPADRYSRQGVRPAALHPRSGAAGHAARPRAAAGAAAAKLIDLKEDGARAVAGLVAIVRDGSFAGVVSETEHGAETGAQGACARARPGARRDAARRRRSGCSS